MAWTNIAKRVVGACIPKSWLDAFIDNMTHLYNLAGGSGTGAGGSLINGSFENDVDLNGVPDGWTWTAYTGGTVAIDATDQGHGAQSVKITSPGGSGNGGGFLETTDFLTCSPQDLFSLFFLLKSSVAGVHNAVDVLWFDKSKNACSTVSTNIYDDTTANPTTWTPFVRLATPPSDAKFLKVRLTGCKNDDATAGSTWLDGLEVGRHTHLASGTITEQSTSSAVFVDAGSFPIWLPTGLVRITLRAEIKGNGSQRFRIGSWYSNEVTVDDGAYTEHVYVFELFGVGGFQTLYQQLLGVGGAPQVGYGRKLAPEIRVEAVLP